MTSTNDGKDVKSNQTSGQKGKTYYIELYKTLDSRLNEEGVLRTRVTHLCEAWRRVHTLCLHSAPSTHPHLLTWIQRHTARTILLTEWQAPNSKDEHTRLEDAINTFIQETGNAASHRESGILPWESQLQARAEWIKTVLSNPWGHPVLRVLLDPRGQRPTTEDILGWLKEERGVVFAARLRQLALAKCDDLALTLLTVVMDRVRRCRPVASDIDLEAPNDPEPQTEDSFESILNKEAGFADLWDLLCDMELVLLHKSERNSRLIDLSKLTPLNNGYQLVERLINRLELAPREKKIWKNVKDVATLISQVMITRCMVLPSCAGVVRSVLYWCTRALVRVLPASRLGKATLVLAAPASTARHLHTLATAVHAQTSADSHVLKPYVVELYVRAITFGMNELEKLKLKPEYEQKEARSTEQTLASWFIQLGQLLGASARMKCECTLTAFSVHPSPIMYERIKTAPRLPPVAVDTQDLKTELPASPSEFGSWASDSRSQTNFVKTSESLNIKHPHHHANVLSTAILNEGEALGLEADLCQDIIVLLSGSRVKTLSWDVDREILLENCRVYMERTHGGTRTLTTELKYLNLDPSQYQHLPEEEDNEDDIYYGIEKGYEHLVEFEPQPEEIWEDAFQSISSSDFEDESFVTRRKKKTKKMSSESDSDPLSLVAEYKRTEKKERPHSKERSKEPDEQQKNDDGFTISSACKESHKPRGKKKDRKEKKKEKKERKKREKKDKKTQSDTTLSCVGTKLTKMTVENSVAKNTCVTDSDYDSQGKSSLQSEGIDENVVYDGQFSMDELKSPEKSPEYIKNLNNELKSARRQITKNLSIQGPVFIKNVALNNISHTKLPYTSNTAPNKMFGSSKHSTKPDLNTFGSTQSPKGDHKIREEVKKSINKLMQFRRQKVSHASTSSMSPIRTDQPSSSTGTCTKTCNAEPKSQNSATMNLNKKQTEQLKAMKSRAKVLKNQNIHHPTNDDIVRPEDTCSRVQPFHSLARIKNMAAQNLETNTQYNVPSISPQRTAVIANNSANQKSETQAQIPLQISQTPGSSHLNSYQQFLEELQKNANAGLQNPPSPPKQTKKKTVLPVNRVTPVPNVATAEPTIHPQCAKPVPQKKVENAPNTFARLSYMHKNKLNEKPKPEQPSPALQHSISDELDRRIAELKLTKAKATLNKTVSISRGSNTQRSKPEEAPQVEIFKVEPTITKAPNLDKEHPALSDILKRNTGITLKIPNKNIESQDNVLHEYSRACTPKSTNSSLTEKDHQEILKLLGQQSLMNAYRSQQQSEIASQANKSNTQFATEDSQVCPSNKPTTGLNVGSSMTTLNVGSSLASHNVGSSMATHNVGPSISTNNFGSSIPLHNVRPSKSTHNTTTSLATNNTGPSIAMPNLETTIATRNIQLSILATHTADSSSSKNNVEPLKTMQNVSTVGVPRSVRPSMAQHNVEMSIIKKKNKTTRPAPAQELERTIEIKKEVPLKLDRTNFQFPVISNTTIIKTTAMIQNSKDVRPKQTKSKAKGAQRLKKEVKSEPTSILVVKKAVAKKYVPKPPAHAPKQAEDDLKEQNWTKVLDALRSHKTPSRGPNALEMMQNKDTFEKVTGRIQRINSPTGNKLDKTHTVIPQVVPSKSTGAVSKVILSHEMVKKVNYQNKSSAVKARPSLPNPLQIYPEVTKQEFKRELQKEEDPFISGIPHSDYEILEELMDDDLRQEIGELSSDEESYQTTVLPTSKVPKVIKNTDTLIKSNVQDKQKPLNPSSVFDVHSKTVMPNAAPKDASQSVRSKPRIISNEKVDIRNLPESVIGSVIRQVPNKASKLQDRTVLNVNNTTVSTPQVPPSINPANVIITPASHAVPNNMVIYDPFGVCSKQNYVTMNTTPHVTLFQQYNANQIIIGSNTFAVPAVNTTVPVNITYTNNQTMTPHMSIIQAPIEEPAFTASSKIDLPKPACIGNVSSTENTNEVVKIPTSDGSKITPESQELSTDLKLVKIIAPKVTEEVGSTSHKAVVRKHLLEKAHMLQTEVAKIPNSGDSEITPELQELSTDPKIYKTIEPKVTEKVELNSNNAAVRKHLMEKAYKSHTEVAKVPTSDDSEITSEPRELITDYKFIKTIDPKVTEEVESISNKAAVQKHLFEKAYTLQAEVAKILTSDDSEITPEPRELSTDPKIVKKIDLKVTEEVELNSSKAAVRKHLLGISYKLQTEVAKIPTSNDNEITTGPQKLSTDPIFVKKIDARVTEAVDSNLNKAALRKHLLGKAQMLQTEVAEIPASDDRKITPEPRGLSAEPKFIKIIQQKVTEEVESNSNNAAVRNHLLEKAYKLQTELTASRNELAEHIKNQDIFECNKQIDVEDIDRVAKKRQTIINRQIEHRLFYPAIPLSYFPLNMQSDEEQKTSSRSSADHTDVTKLNNKLQTLETITEIATLVPEKTMPCEDILYNTQINKDCQPESYATKSCRRILLRSSNTIIPKTDKTENVVSQKTKVRLKVLNVNHEGKSDDSYVKKIPQTKTVVFTTHKKTDVPSEEKPSTESTATEKVENFVEEKSEAATANQTKTVVFTTHKKTDVPSEEKPSTESTATEKVENFVEEKSEAATANISAPKRVSKRLLSKKVKKTKEKEEELKPKLANTSAEDKKPKCCKKKQPTCSPLEPYNKDNTQIVSKVESVLETITAPFDVEEALVGAKILKACANPVRKSQQKTVKKNEKPLVGLNITKKDKMPTTQNVNQPKSDSVEIFSYPEVCFINADPLNKINASKIDEKIKDSLTSVPINEMGSTTISNVVDIIETVEDVPKKEENVVRSALDQSASAKNLVAEKNASFTKDMTSEHVSNCDEKSSSYTELIPVGRTSEVINKFSKLVTDIASALNVITETTIGSPRVESPVDKELVDETTKVQQLIDNNIKQSSMVVDSSIIESPKSDVAEKCAAVITQCEKTDQNEIPPAIAVKESPPVCLITESKEQDITDSHDLSGSVEKEKSTLRYNKITENIAIKPDENARNPTISNSTSKGIVKEIDALLQSPNAEIIDQFNIAETNKEKSPVVNAIIKKSASQPSHEIIQEIKDQSHNVAISSNVILENACLSQQDKRTKENENDEVILLNDNIKPKSKAKSATKSKRKENIQTSSPESGTATEKCLPETVFSQSFKDSLIIEEIEIPGNVNPLKRCVRIKLPNKKYIRVTVHSKYSISLDTLFKEPSFIKLIQSNINEHCIVNIPVKVFHGKQTEATVTPKLPVQDYNKSRTNIETVNLVSDDEDILSQEITTKAGSYKIKPINEDILNKHQDKLLQKCSIKLRRCDERPKTDDLIKALLADCGVPSENPEPSEIIEIDSSSDDELTPSTNIDNLKDLLLKDLGVADINISDKKTDTPKKIPSRFRKPKPNRNLEKQAKSLEPEKRIASLKRHSSLVSVNQNLSKPDYSHIIPRECVINLVRCDHMINKLEQTKHGQKNILVDEERIIEDDQNNVELRRSGSFSLLNYLEQGPTIEHEISSVRISSPVMEIYDMIATLQEKSKRSTVDKLDNGNIFACEWFQTKCSHNLIIKRVCGKEQLIERSGIFTDCETDVTDLSDSENIEVPKLKSIVAKYFERNSIINKHNFSSQNADCETDVTDLSDSETIEVPKLKSIVAKYFEKNSIINKHNFSSENADCETDVTDLSDSENIEVPKLKSIVAKYFERNSIINKHNFSSENADCETDVTDLSDSENIEVPKLKSIVAKYFERNSIINKHNFSSENDTEVSKIPSLKSIMALYFQGNPLINELKPLRTMLIVDPLKTPSKRKILNQDHDIIFSKITKILDKHPKDGGELLSKIEKDTHASNNYENIPTSQYSKDAIAEETLSSGIKDTNNGAIDSSENNKFDVVNTSFEMETPQSPSIFDMSAIDAKEPILNVEENDLTKNQVQSEMNSTEPTEDLSRSPCLLVENTAETLPYIDKESDLCDETNLVKDLLESWNKSAMNTITETLDTAISPSMVEQIMDTKDQIRFCEIQQMSEIVKMSKVEQSAILEDFDKGKYIMKSSETDASSRRVSLETEHVSTENNESMEQRAKIVTVPLENSLPVENFDVLEECMDLSTCVEPEVSSSNKGKIKPAELFMTVDETEGLQNILKDELISCTLKNKLIEHKNESVEAEETAVVKPKSPATKFLRYESKVESVANAICHEFVKHTCECVALDSKVNVSEAAETYKQTSMKIESTSEYKPPTSVDKYQEIFQTDCSEPDSPVEIPNESTTVNADDNLSKEASKDGRLNSASFVSILEPALNIEISNNLFKSPLLQENTLKQKNQYKNVEEDKIVILETDIERLIESVTVNSKVDIINKVDACKEVMTDESESISVIPNHTILSSLDENLVPEQTAKTGDILGKPFLNGDEVQPDNVLLEDISLNQITTTNKEQETLESLGADIETKITNIQHTTINLPQSFNISSNSSLLLPKNMSDGAREVTKCESGSIEIDKTAPDEEVLPTILSQSSECDSIKTTTLMAEFKEFITMDHFVSTARTTPGKEKSDNFETESLAVVDTEMLGNVNIESGCDDRMDDISALNNQSVDTIAKEIEEEKVVDAIILKSNNNDIKHINNDSIKLETSSNAVFVKSLKDDNAIKARDSDALNIVAMNFVDIAAGLEAANREEDQLLITYEQSVIVPPKSSTKKEISTSDLNTQEILTTRVKVLQEVVDLTKKDTSIKGNIHLSGINIFVKNEDHTKQVEKSIVEKSNEEGSVCILTEKLVGCDNSKLTQTDMQDNNNTNSSDYLLDSCASSQKLTHDTEISSDFPHYICETEVIIEENQSEGEELVDKKGNKKNTSLQSNTSEELPIDLLKSDEHLHAINKSVEKVADKLIPQQSSTTDELSPKPLKSDEKPVYDFEENDIIIEKSIEEIQCEENIFENSATLVYKDDSGVILKGIEYEDPEIGTCYVFPLSKSSEISGASDLLNVSFGSSIEVIHELDISDANEMVIVNSPEPSSELYNEIDLKVIVPKFTYSKRNLKRKSNTKDVYISEKRARRSSRSRDSAEQKTVERRYRKGKNIDYPKMTAGSIAESSYGKEFKRVLEYYSTVEFSFSITMSEEFINVPELLEDWPIKGPVTYKSQNEATNDFTLFKDLEEVDRAIYDPLRLTFVEEITTEYRDTDYANGSDNEETNLKMGFGEGSGRVIQNLNGGAISKFSAATLSDVKQSQPFLLSKTCDDKKKIKSLQSSKHDQIETIKRFFKNMKLREKVRSFFRNIELELSGVTNKDKNKDKIDNKDASLFPFEIYISKLIEPRPIDTIVQVVQVGQLPVSAAAQNPVTCDPRVTQVSNASPPQCSAENSPHDDSQSDIKTEYTELTTADLSLPMVEDYVQHNQTIPMECQEVTNVSMNTENIPIETELVKAEVKIELEEDSPEEKDKSMENHVNDVEFLYDSNHTCSSVKSEFESLFEEKEEEEKRESSETFPEGKPQNEPVEKTDQIAHAMNAAGITTTSETVINTRAQAFVNMLSQKIRPGGVATPNSGNNYAKTSSINAMALQQALAQILPPPLNQTNSSENNQQGTPQVLHIVQGKNASGNQITLVDNSQQSVITTPNATPVLHIVQNKAPAPGSTSNGSPGPQTNTFSGISLVDAGLQQGGNQLLHIVNTGNQKNNNTNQLLKRVNLLTNLANVQGSNEQKMVQFVCKSADGKSIQLNAPHQRSMVLRLQPIESPNVQPATPKPTENQDLSPTQSSVIATNKEIASTQQEIKSRSVYEENYAKFIQNSSNKPSVLEKSTSLPKFNQAFGKPVFQDGNNQKQNEINSNSLSSVNTSAESTECSPTENSINLDHIGPIKSPPLLIRKSNPPAQTSQAQTNLMQQIKQTIAPMNIQTMHGGVIYTRQIPVNIGGGQTINLITVPSTELIDENGQKQQVNQGEIEPSIIKIVPQNQPPPNAEVTSEGINNANNDNAQQTQPQPQPVLTQMRIKLPMLSKNPHMVSGARVVRPSFFQIQRNIVGGANQPVYQQLVLTAAPPLGQQTIRLPQAQARTIKVPENQSESQMSSSTLEQLREFDMVLEQVKERSTVQPNPNPSSGFKLHAASTDTTDSPTFASSTSAETTTQVLYSIGSNQSLNVTYVNRKSTINTPTTSTFVRSPDSSGIADSPSSSSHVQIPHTVTTESSSSEASTQSKPVKVSSKSKSRPKSSSHHQNTMKLNTVPPKTSSQKPLEDEQTTQRILYILAEYKEQVENSPDKDKPAPRRRSNPPSNPGSSKRKKSSSGSRRSGTRDLSPILGDDSCRTMGSEDSSCGTSQGDCNESCLDSHSPQDSPRKIVRKLAFEQEPSTPQPKPQPQRNVIVADGQTITVARGTTGKPATAVLMPANYILPVSMVKGGQQIAIVTNRGPKLLTVGGGEGGATNALLLQRLIGPAGLKPVLARPGVRHVRLPTAALHNLQAFNLATATTVQPPDSTASPAPETSPPDLIETNRSDSSPWADRDTESVKPDRTSSPDESEPWNLPSSADPNDYSYEEIVRTDNLDQTVLDPIPDRYSPDMEAQRIFDKMFDVDTKKSSHYIVDSVDSPRCGYDIDESDSEVKPYQVVQKKDSSHRQARFAHVSAAALRHKYAILEHELRLQKSLSEECEDLGVDSPSASELFPEAELLFAASPAQDHASDTPQHSHTPQPTLHNQSAIQPDIDDQIATDHILHRENVPEERQDLDVNCLEDVGIVTVSEDGMQATIALDQEEFARAHPNTTFHSEPTDEVEVQPFTITGLKSRHIASTIFHSNRAPATVLMTAPQATVISQVTGENSQNSVKYSDIDNMINAIPSTHTNTINLSSVLVKDEGLTRFDNILTDSRELHLSNTASAIVHSASNATQVIRRVCYDDNKRERESYLMDEPDALIAGDDAKMVAEDSSRDATMESMGGDVDDGNSSPERHAELFWESNSASERSESRRPLDFSSDSEKCCKSPSYDETNSTDSSGVGTHMRLDSVIKEARGIDRSGSADGSSADDTHPPLRTYPAKRLFHSVEGDIERSLSGKTRAGERSPDLEVRRRASGRGVVKRGCHCCNGSPAPPRTKKPRQRKPTTDFTS